jgi:hypothetical protein
MSKRAMLNAEGKHLSLKHHVKNTKAKNYPIAERWEHRLHAADTRCLLPVPFDSHNYSHLLTAKQVSSSRYRWQSGPVCYTARVE